MIHPREASGPAKLGNSLHRIVHFVEKSESIARVAGPVQVRAAHLLNGRRLSEALHGTWLGHSAHPFFTDFPEGAWMAASFLDIFGPEGSEAPAQRLLGFGLIAAVPTALTGLADWSRSVNAERQSGMFHALTSSVATLLYAASYLARRRDQRVPAVALGLAGGLMATLDGWVGGHLSLARGVGVQKNALHTPPSEWTATSLGGDAVDEKSPVPGTLGEIDILAVKLGGRIRIVPARCSFDGEVLSPDAFSPDVVVCPAHGCVFSMEDGRVLAGPASVPITVLEARTAGGRLEARAPAAGVPDAGESRKVRAS